jgi:hypothetical protein
MVFFLNSSNTLGRQAISCDIPNMTLVSREHTELPI